MTAAASSRVWEVGNVRRSMVMASLMVALGSSIATGQTAVYLRGDRDTPIGQLRDATTERVLIEYDDGTAIAVAWDRIRALRGDDAAIWAESVARGRAAWRARTRLERGDAALAEPVFERLAEGGNVIGGEAYGETSALIDEGLLRCRLRRGAVGLAVEPWLRLVGGGAMPAPARIRPGAQAADGIVTRAATWDAQSVLIPAMFPGIAKSDAMDEDSILGPIDSPAGALRRAYVEASRGVLGEEVDVGLVRAIRDAAADGPLAGDTRFRIDIVLSLSASPDARAEARGRLVASLGNQVDAGPVLRDGAWREAWSGMARGLSLLRESDRTKRLDGALQLVSVRVSAEASQPWLATLAGAYLARALHDDGQAAAGQRIAVDTAAFFPSHPANDWVDLAAMVEGAGVPGGRIEP